MTEIYLTDCWCAQRAKKYTPPKAHRGSFKTMPGLYATRPHSYEEDAEQRCEKYLADAARWDDKNPEVYQSLASVRLSQQRPEDAAQLMQQNLALWMPQRTPPRAGPTRSAPVA